MINEFPADTPVTNPVEASTVATPKGTLDQVPPFVTSANGVVEPTHTVAAPMIAATVGKAFTVATTAVLVAVVHPLLVAST